MTSLTWVKALILFLSLIFTYWVVDSFVKNTIVYKHIFDKGEPVSINKIKNGELASPWKVIICIILWVAFYIFSL